MCHERLACAKPVQFEAGAKDKREEHDNGVLSCVKSFLICVISDIVECRRSKKKYHKSSRHDTFVEV